MEKYIKITVGSDDRLIKVTGIAKIAVDGVAPTTETDITYLNGETVTLTHAAVTGAAQVVAIEGLISKALIKNWTEPVYDATSDTSLAAVSAIA